MILGLVFLACLATVPLARGRLTALADLKLRRPWLALAGIGVQVLIISVVPAGPAHLHEGVHMLSYALLGAFAWANRAIPGVKVILLGGLLNFVAIAANGGVMPADPDVAAAAANHAAAGEFINSAPASDARLGFLGDVLATPTSLPLHNVYSAGDVVIVLGLLIVVHAACHRQKAASSRARPTGSS
jgi:hypothetical protein